MSLDKRWRLHILEYNPCLTEEEYNNISLTKSEPQTYKEYIRKYKKKMFL